MSRYRLVTYSSRGNDYVQIVRSVKTKDGRWTTKLVTHIPNTRENIAAAERLTGFLERYASSDDAPVAVGTVHQDFFVGLKIGLLLGPLALPAAPLLALGDFVSYIGKYMAQKSGDISRIVDATQPHLAARERGWLAEWMRTINSPEDRALASYFKWSYTDD